jgi:hypothetical protein
MRWFRKDIFDYKWTWLDCLMMFLGSVAILWFLAGAVRVICHAGECTEICKPDTQGQISNDMIWWEEIKCTCSSPREIKLRNKD